MQRLRREDPIAYSDYLQVQKVCVFLDMGNFLAVKFIIPGITSSN